MTKLFLGFCCLNSVVGKKKKKKFCCRKCNYTPASKTGNSVIKNQGYS